MAEFIEKTDTLNQGREKLNSAIKDAEDAKNISGEADEKATQALSNSESTQTQLDTIVIEGDSSVEAAQARVDEKGEAHPTLKARIDNGFTEVTSQLAQTMVHISQFAIENIGGEYDITNIFETAKNFTKSIGSTLNLPNGTYRLKLTKDTELPKIKGNNSTLIVEGNHSLIIDDNSEIDDLKILSTNVYDVGTDPINKKPVIRGDDITTLKLNNLTIVADVDYTGDRRGYKAIHLNGVKDLKTKGVIRVEGYRYAVDISRGKSSNIYIDTLECLNVETGLYSSGSSPNNSSQDFVDNIQIGTLKLINTPEQSLKYERVEGSSAIMLEKCRNVYIDTLYSEYAVERSAYLNVVENVKINNLTTIGKQSIKVAGSVRYDMGYANFSRNVEVINHKHIVPEFESDGVSWLLYFVDELRVKNFELIGGDKRASQIIHSSSYLKDTVFENVKFDGIDRFILQHVNSTISSNPDLGIPENPWGNFPSTFENVTFKNIEGKNIGRSIYYAFEFLDEMGGDEYRFKNIKIDNVNIKNQDEPFGLFLDRDNTSLRGLLNIEKVDGLTVKNSNIQGYYAYPHNEPYFYPFQVGDKSKNVNIHYTQVLKDYNHLQKFNLGELNVDSSSELEFKIEADHYIDIGKLEINPYKSTRGKIIGESKDGVSFDYKILWLNQGVFTSVYGEVNVSTSNGKHATFVLSEDGQVTLNQDADPLFSPTDAGGKISLLFRDNNYLCIKDRSGLNIKLLIDYNLIFD